MCASCLFLGLILLFLHSQQGLLEMSPGQCCYKFFTGRIPPKKIVSVFKSDSTCLEKAFVIGTTSRRRICVSQSVTWAQEAFASMTNPHNDYE
uniref:Chemokine interleukin-8-like domain-containing protein n=1 Tax=Maylandia zebra TaxID=106582 RepID=A0A3P9CCU1_9CICH